MQSLVSLAKFLMRLWEATPQPNDPTLRERFNLREFLTATPDEREQFMLEIARQRHASECELPIHKLFGLTQQRMTGLLHGKTVMELGCFVGGSAVAHAEAYGAAVMWGVDIEDVFLEAARLFVRGRRGEFAFWRGSGEAIPLATESCDAIITQDTLEHVHDVHATLRECQRVLRPGGLLFAVFPSFYHPWGNHLGMVTNMPWLHAVFSDAVLEAAYRAIVAERGSQAYWYVPENSLAMNRGRFHGVNGITASTFRQIAAQLRFPIVHRHVAPLFGVGRRVQRHPWLRAFSFPLLPLAGIPGLEEFLVHRVCYVLQKTPRDWPQ